MNFANVEKLVIPEGEVIKISHGSTVLWECTDFSTIYQQVEYIQTDGNQAIDTGIKASDHQDGLEYVFSGCCTGIHSSKNTNYLFGCLNSGKRSGNPAFQSGNVITIIIGGTGEGNFYNTHDGLNTDFTLEVKGTSRSVADLTVKYNDRTITNSSTVSNGDMPSANIYLLACNINGNYYSSTSAPFTGKLYSFVMSDMNGNEIRHFVPCYRRSDGVIGLYDTVNGTFYTNKGTGSFTKGADV